MREAVMSNRKCEYSEKVQIGVQSSHKCIRPAARTLLGAKRAKCPLIDSGAWNREVLRPCSGRITLRGYSIQPANLTVKSMPDINLDGEFMGSTPSTIQLSPGEHLVSVEKEGLRP